MRARTTHSIENVCLRAQELEGLQGRLEAIAVSAARREAAGGVEELQKELRKGLTGWDALRAGLPKQLQQEVRLEAWVVWFCLGGNGQQGRSSCSRLEEDLHGNA